LEGAIATEVANYIRAFSEHQDAEIVELNVQIDHVYREFGLLTEYYEGGM
jgi:REP element-mobilizing transposase RayT